MTKTYTINTINGINLDTLRETVNAIQEQPELGECKFRVRNKWIDGDRNCTSITTFYGAKQEHQHQKNFVLECDEPPVLAGRDSAPNPVEHLLNALAGCLTTSIVAHAAVQGIHIEELESEIEGDLDLRGFLGISNTVPRQYKNIRVHFRIKSDEKNMERLKRLAQFSPVYNTLIHGTSIDLQIEPK